MSIFDIFADVVESIGKTAANVIDPNDYNEGDKVDVVMPDGSTRSGTIVDGTVKVDDD